MENRNIKYYSTNCNAPEVSFSEALLKGLAPDGGLYLPDSVPILTQKNFQDFQVRLYYQIASVILNKFVGDEIPEKELEALCTGCI